MKYKVTFEIVLFQPEIPPNTGNIIRICANTGSRLHLIKPIGFDIGDKAMRRAGMDYSKKVNINLYNNLDDFVQKNLIKRLFLVTKFGEKNYNEYIYKIGDYFMFGSESSGFTDEVFKKLKNQKKIFIPMLPNSRSINLANAVSICIYEAWKQNKFNYFKIIK